MKKLHSPKKIVPSSKTGNIHYGLEYQLSNTQKKFLINNCSAYIPKNNDYIICKIISCYSEYYLVRINSYLTGVLPNLSFYNATKKNRPVLESGDFVYTQIIMDEDSTMKGTQLLLTCNSPDLGKLEIKKIGESENFCSTMLEMRKYAKKLLYDEILIELGKKYQFVIVIGLNGLVYLKCKDGEDLYEISTALLDFYF